MKNYLKVFFYFFVVLSVYGQAPSIAYTTPNTFTVNQSIAGLPSNNSGGSIPNQPIVTTLAGSGTAGAADQFGTSASFNYPTVVTLDHEQNVVVVDRSNHKIRKINPEGQVTTIAGVGSIGATDGSALSATFRFPDAAVVDSYGNIFITDQSNHTIRKIDTNGQVSTFAGTGAGGYLDGEGLSSKFYYPAGIAIDAQNILYVADYGNHKIRKITPTGIVSTHAGSNAGNLDGINGVGKFNGPTGVCLDAQGNVYVADYGNHKIRKVDHFGRITTVAGSGTAGAVDGTATNASFYHPAIVSINANHELFVTDQGNHKIRKIDTNGVVSTYAGTGTAGSLDAKADFATFNSPSGVVAGSDDIVYVCDYANHKIRKIKKYGYSVTPNLPQGLFLNSITGEISGLPTVASPMTDYTVTASNQFGSVATIVAIEVQAALSDSNFNSNDVSVYPNPVKDKFTISKAQAVITVSVFDALGQPVRKIETGAPEHILDLSCCESGVYFCKITSGSEIKEIKILKE